jgi:muramoyltetrapeptide carboxypeptidase
MQFDKQKKEKKCIGIVSPASSLKDMKTFYSNIRKLESYGYTVKVSKFACIQGKLTAGTDKQRGKDFVTTCSDPGVDIVLCSRGGYGSVQLLDLLDMKFRKRLQKQFVGYSDITTLHLYFQQFRNSVTYHGPGLTSLFQERAGEAYRIEMLQRALSAKNTSWSIINDEQHLQSKVHVLRRGKAKGKLTGGNLTIICSHLGTPLKLNFSEKILFLEEVNEPPYKVDRMLTQLLRSGVLKGVMGIACGAFSGVNEKEENLIIELITEKLSFLKVPILYGLPIGHIPFNATIPVGQGGILATASKELVLLA